jgi:16S rRNA (guanine966-N2)-methyltransferase
MIRICAGAFKGKKLRVYDGGEVRPTTDQLRQSIFNILLNRMYLTLEGSNALDLYAGSGGLGLEALSRGVDFCSFVEKDHKTAKVLAQNIQSIEGIHDKTKLYTQDCMQFLNQCTQSFDLLFCDPPYQAQNSPDILKLIAQKNLIKPQGIIVFEHHSKDEFEVSSPWKLYLRRKYGDSSISICVLESSDWAQEEKE